MMTATPAPDLQFVDTATDAAGTPATTAQQFPRTPLPNGFTWFDGSDLNKLGDLAPTAFTKVSIDGGAFWPTGVTGHNGPLSEANTRAFARRAAALSGVAVIDIEDWNLDLRGASPSEIDKSVAKFHQIITWMRNERPQLKIGIYDFMSIGDAYASTEFPRYDALAASSGGWYTAALPWSADAYADWQAASAYLQTLSQDVDYVFPSIYTSADDATLWTDYARSLINDSRRFGKPVIPFIWPQFRNPTGPSADLQFMSSALWQAQLDFVRANADGVCIWTDHGYAFDPAAAWVGQAIAKASLDLRVIGGTGLDAVGGGDSGTDSGTEVGTSAGRSNTLATARPGPTLVAPASRPDAATVGRRISELLFGSDRAIV